MARSSNQKLKILYIMDFLLKNSDEDHPVSINEIIQHLNANEISAERKSIYDDIEALRLYGLDIIQTKNGAHYGYYVAERDFELPELKLLVDTVQSSKFITHKKTTALIKKLESLTSVHGAKMLNRQVFVKNRIKTMNESIYYNVDEIHNAMALNKKIRFRYFEFNVQKERQYRRNGEFYEVSPFSLTWDDENYYLVAYDSEAQRIKHYRVDKMEKIRTLDEDRDGLDAYRNMDLGVYARKTFGMFTGRDENVELRLENHLVGVVLDRLGRDVFIIPDGPDHFTIRTQIAVSPQFFAWVLGLSPAAKIISPVHVVEEMKAYIAAAAKLYE